MLTRGWIIAIAIAAVVVVAGAYEYEKHVKEVGKTKMWLDEGKRIIPDSSVPTKKAWVQAAYISPKQCVAAAERWERKKVPVGGMNTIVGSHGSRPQCHIFHEDFMRAGHYRQVDEAGSTSYRPFDIVY